MHLIPLAKTVAGSCAGAKQPGQRAWKGFNSGNEVRAPRPSAPGAKLIAAFLLASALVQPAAAAVVRVRVLVGGETTPVMVCITDAQGRVRLPPDGRVVEKMSVIDDFFDGVPNYRADADWIGPVRMTMGRGNNRDRSTVYQLLPSLPHWREPAMYQTSGDFSIALPPGRWRLAVARGMEFVPHFEDFAIGDEAALEKTVTLERWVNLPARGWWSGDAHVHHPILEDSHREYLLAYARAEDVHVVNVLEVGDSHRTTFRQLGFGREFRTRRGDYALIAGQEEPRGTFGHVMGLNIGSFVRDKEHYDFYDLAFRRIGAQDGALVGFAHFSWNGTGLPRGFPWYVTTGGLDFVELLQFSRLNQMDYYDYLNLGFRLTAAAGSDFPWGSTIGEVRTFVHTGPTFDIDAWYRGLKAGRSFVSNGPVLEFTVDGELPGATLVREPGQRVRLAARTFSHPAIGRLRALSIMGNDGVLHEAVNPGAETELVIDLDRPIAESQWLVASAVSDNGGLAHTTPVYVTVSGRPTYSRTRGPAVIEKQLAAMARVRKEFSAAKTEREKGILERLDRAERYYTDLLIQMKK